MTDPTPKSTYIRRRHVDVMISSTARDLPAHREAAFDATFRCSLFPIVMETLSAHPADAIQVSLDMVDQAEVYVGIFGYRYGYVPDDPARNPGKISITEMEYRRAVERKIPILIFLMGDDHPGPATVAERDAFFERDPENERKLTALKDELKTNYVVAFFNSPQDLGGKVLQALMNLAATGVIEATEQTERSLEDARLSRPPEPHIAHPYILTQKFFGRQAELKQLDEWAASDDSTLIVEAIGGVGKSALTWEWVNNHREKFDFDGVLWWSFYESDAAVSNFTRHALAYVTGQTVRAVGTMPQDERERRLLAVLSEKRYLLVLDGLERILVAYHRIDASHILDDQVQADLRGCTDDRHALFLQQLTDCGTTKILISTRLRPSALENRAKQLLPRVQHFMLNGLHPQDALALMQHYGVTFRNEAALLDFMEQFGRHSLLLGVIAGRIADYRPAPGDFDEWYADEGQSLKLSEIDLAQRRTGILQYAFDGLKPELRKLLRQVAAFRYPVSYAALKALNPYTEADDSVAQFHAGLSELEGRGLLQWNRDPNRYDLHPIVRAYAFEELQGEERTATFLQIRDHFESLPPGKDEDTPTEITHLQRLFEIYHALVGAGLLDEAAAFYSQLIKDHLFKEMGAYHSVIELAQPLFGNGLDALPTLTSRDAKSEITTHVANALFQLGRIEQTLVLRQLQIDLRLGRLYESSYLGIGLRNYAESLEGNSAHYATFRVRTLALELAQASHDGHGQSKSYVSLQQGYVNTGQWDQATAAYNDFQRHQPSWDVEYWQSAAERNRAAQLILQGQPAADILDESLRLAKLGRNALSLRQVPWLHGETALLAGDLPRAETFFLDAIAVARKQGAADIAVFQGRLAVVQAHLGQQRAALQQLGAGFMQSFRMHEWDVQNSAAEVYLLLGERDQAAEYAVEAYRLSWADGPPHSWWWGLERAQRTLAELGIDPPDMPPFDPARVVPLPFEDKVREQIKELKGRNR